jgi:hypothetical protein
VAKVVDGDLLLLSSGLPQAITAQRILAAGVRSR